MLAERWEHGSEFHWPEEPMIGSVEHPWSESSVLYGTGRDPLIALLIEHGIRRLWAPAYFCEEVLDSAAAVITDLEVCRYPASPLESHASIDGISVGEGDALLVVNLLGLQQQSDLPHGVVGIGHTSCILAQRPGMGVMLNTQGEPRDGQAIEDSR